MTRAADWIGVSVTETSKTAELDRRRKHEAEHALTDRYSLAPFFILGWLQAEARANPAVLVALEAAVTAAEAEALFKVASA
jgi:hypothetical protein